MRSKWIDYKGKKIFFQDFSNLSYDTEAVKQELAQVQAEVVSHPKNSLLILSDFRDTNLTTDLMPILNASSALTKEHVAKTAVLGVTGVKRTLADLLTRLTGQALKYFDTEEAERERKEFKALSDGKPNNITMAYHWARMIELLHSAEKICELLNDSDLQGEDLVVRGDRRDEAVGIIEAPRGTLFHHYKVNEDDQVVMANLIVSTTSNNEPMNRAVQKVAEDYLSGVPKITEGLLNRVEVAIRAYDPCLSCATHAVGKMPLIIEFLAPDGTVIDQLIKE